MIHEEPLRSDGTLAMLELDASDVARHPDAIDRILRRDLFGVMMNAFGWKPSR